MVPIVGTAIEATPLSIFDPASSTQYALNGLRLKNTTGMHLAGGPITVINDGMYGGDAQVNNLQPGDERLVSYAVDLELLPDWKPASSDQFVTSISAKSGVLIIKRKQQLRQVFSFRNKSDDDKSVLVQYRDPGSDYTIIEPAKSFEKTPTEYRYLMMVPAGKTADLKVVAERPLQETIALFNADLNVLIYYTQNGQVPEKLRAALKQLVAMRQHIVDLQTSQSDLQSELNSIDQEQNRIRLNMAQLDRNSALYSDYVKKLTAQEDRVEKVKAEMKRLRDAELAAQKEMRDYVDGLTME